MFDLSPRPFVLNRDVTDHEIVIETYAQGGYVLINSTEYDGMSENPYVLALNRISAFNAIREWERDEDYFIDNEYAISFYIEYNKKLGDKMVPTSARFALAEGMGTSKDYQQLEDALRSVILDLEQPETMVSYLSINGMTDHKLWVRIDTQMVDFTPV